MLKLIDWSELHRNLKLNSNEVASDFNQVKKKKKGKKPKQHQENEIENQPSILISLPKDIWKFIISYCSKRELGSLRQVNHWFKEQVQWKLWIPFEELENYKTIYKKLKWDLSSNFCGLFYKKKVPDLRNLPSYIQALNLSNCTISFTNQFQKLPPNLRELNLTNCTNLDESELKYLPKTLNFLILPWNGSIYKKGVLYLLQMSHLYFTFDCERSVLYWSCFNGHVDLVKIILNEKNWKMDPNDPALSVACQRGYEDIATLLLAHGVNPNVGNIYGRSPLMSAISFGHEKIISLLLKYGSDVNQKDLFGESPLQKASQNPKLLKLLQENY